MIKAPDNQDRLAFELGTRDEDEEDATEKQKAFIRALMRDVGAKDERSVDLDSLGKWQASHFIDQLIELRDDLAIARLANSSSTSEISSDAPALPTPSGGEEKLKLGLAGKLLIFALAIIIFSKILDQL